MGFRLKTKLKNIAVHVTVRLASLFQKNLLFKENIIQFLLLIQILHFVSLGSILINHACKISSFKEITFNKWSMISNSILQVL